MILLVEVADDDEDVDDSLRNVGDGNLCRDEAYIKDRRECGGERKTGDVDAWGILADCDDDDDDEDRDEDDEFLEEDESAESERARCVRAMSAVHDSIRIELVFR